MAFSIIRHLRLLSYDADAMATIICLGRRKADDIFWAPFLCIRFHLYEYLKLMSISYNFSIVLRWSAGPFARSSQFFIAFRRFNDWVRYAIELDEALPQRRHRFRATMLQRHARLFLPELPHLADDCRQRAALSFTACWRRASAGFTENAIIK